MNNNRIVTSCCRRRNPSDWTYNNIPQDVFIDRGFTGHEHLDQFNLINMNGRIYDPLLAMFLSPDNYVQSPDLTLNFNRYSYALNNPLVFTDPTGNTRVPYPRELGVFNYDLGPLATGRAFISNGTAFTLSQIGIHEAGPTSKFLKDWLEPGMNLLFPSYPEYYTYRRDQESKTTTGYYEIPFASISLTSYGLVNGHLSEIQKPGSVEIGILRFWVDLDVLAGGGQYPIDDPYISSDYGMRNGEMHNGVDFVNQQKGTIDGKPVYSVTNGTVVRLVTTPDGNRAGVRVRIQASSGYQYNYFHLQDGSNSHLQNNMIIKKGDIIGNVGNTGFSRGAHLHFEIWSPDGTKVNPYDIYPALYNIPHR